MAIWEVAVALLAVMGAVAIGFTLPLLIRLKRAVEHMERLLHDAELNLGPILFEVREITRNLNKVSSGVAEGVSQVSPTFQAIGEIGKTLHGANLVLRGALGPGVTVAAGLIAGIKAGGRVLGRRLFRRR